MEIMFRSYDPKMYKFEP